MLCKYYILEQNSVIFSSLEFLLKKFHTVFKTNKREKCSSFLKLIGGTELIEAHIRHCLHLVLISQHYILTN